MAVTIDYLGSAVSGEVQAVEDEGRRIVVHTDDDRTVSFALNRATATFTADGSQTGPRLRFAR
jgi:hypothetical protein